MLLPKAYLEKTMRNYTILFCLALALAACRQSGEVETPAENQLHLVAENSLFLLTEELLRVYQEQVPEQPIACTYGTPAEIQRLFIEGKAELLLGTNPLRSDLQRFADTSGIEIVSEWLGRESLWYFGPRNQQDSLLCTQAVSLHLNQTSRGKAAILCAGYPDQPLGLFESMLGKPVTDENFTPVAHPPFERLDSLWKQFPEAWGVIGSSEWLLSPSREKTAFAQACRWKHLVPCGEKHPEDRLRYRNVQLMNRSAAGGDVVRFWRGKVGQVWLRRSGVK